MVLASMRRVSRTIAVLCGGSTAHEIAMGIALGTILGLIPKANLTAVLLCALILSLRLNLTAALFAAGISMSLAPLLDGVAHPLGLTILSFRPLQGLWSSLLRQPIVPWLQLDQTVVLGELMIGLLVAWPLYRLSRSAVARLQPGVAAVMNHSSVSRLLEGMREPAQRRAA